MTGLAKKLEQGVVQDKCGDHSMGHNKAYAYLEGKLSDEEAQKFVAHVENCSYCLEIIVRWHYEGIVTEIDNRNMTAKTDKTDNKNLTDNKIENTDWDWDEGGGARTSENAPLSNNQKLRHH